MILTVTPNPSLDLLFTADGPLLWDDANRVDAPRRRPGGQGINATRAARVLGGSSEAVALLGGTVGAALAHDLEAEGTPLHPVPIAGETRTFVAIREAHSGRSLLINPRGPECDASDAIALLEAVTRAIRPGVTWVVSSGSVPPGLPAGLHARVGALASEHGARFVADCDGPALADAARAGLCDLLVPNVHEAGRLAGRPIDGPDDAGRAARSLLDHAPRVAIKLGALGAVYADATGTWYAAPPPLRGGSAVGAGDAFLAALLLELDRHTPAPHALTRAVATGTAVLRSRGAAILDRGDAEDLSARIEIRMVP